MQEDRRTVKKFLLAFVLALPLIFLAEAGQMSSRTFIIHGHSGEVAILEKDGRSYVEIEALARLTKGSLTFNGKQVILTLPGTAGSSGAVEAAQPAATGFSKEFIRAGIEEIAVIREWRSTLKNAVQRGFPVTEDWTENYRARAEQSLRLVSLAASTESDKRALQLLTNEYSNMKTLSDRFVEANKSRTYVSHQSLDNDASDQRILNCARSLAAMAASGQFADDGSCH